VPTTKEDENWMLGVDSQSSALIQLKQQLTYFLITASMAVIGFGAAIANGRPGAWEAALAWPTILASALLALTGLGCAGLCLLYLYLGNQSFVLHLKYRYQRTTYEDLKKEDQTQWDNLTNRANQFLELSFVLLFIEILAALVFFWLLITSTVPPVTQD